MSAAGKWAPTAVAAADVNNSGCGSKSSSRSSSSKQKYTFFANSCRMNLKKTLQNKTFWIFFRPISSSRFARFWRPRLGRKHSLGKLFFCCWPCFSVRSLFLITHTSSKVPYFPFSLILSISVRVCQMSPLLRCCRPIDGADTPQPTAACQELSL